MNQFLLPKSIFILIDPEKEGDLEIWKQKSIDIANNDAIHGILLGGSTLKVDYGNEIINTFKKHTSKPIIGFPGSSQQIYKNLDAVLFLNYLNSDTTLFTRTEPLNASDKISKYKIPTLPCAYIIINPQEKNSSTLIETDSKAFHPIKDKTEIMKRVIFAWHSGQRFLYLEAGSGSSTSVAKELIQEIKSLYDFHIIVGGGISNKEDAKLYHNLGAETVVIGTAVENDPNLIGEL